MNTPPDAVTARFKAKLLLVLIFAFFALCGCLVQFARQDASTSKQTGPATSQAMQPPEERSPRIVIPLP